MFDKIIEISLHFLQYFAVCFNPNSKRIIQLISSTGRENVPTNQQMYLKFPFKSCQELVKGAEKGAFKILFKTDQA